MMNQSLSQAAFPQAEKVHSVIHAKTKQHTWH